jgi:hypothetical protein
MQQAILSGQLGGALDPCAALQVKVVLQPCEQRRVVFLLGEGDDHEHAVRLIARHGHTEAADSALERAQRFWNGTLDTIHVRTPDDSFDALVNRWLLYQDVSCRLWTRGGYYQPGGAYGFRDQLQDVMALFFSQPALKRDHLRAAGGSSSGRRSALVARNPGRGLQNCSDDLSGCRIVTPYVRGLAIWMPSMKARFLAAPLLRRPGRVLRHTDVSVKTAPCSSIASGRSTKARPPAPMVYRFSVRAIGTTA